MKTNAKIYVFEGKDGTLKLGHSKCPLIARKRAS